MFNPVVSGSANASVRCSPGSRWIANPVSRSLRVHPCSATPALATASNRFWKQPALPGTFWQRDQPTERVFHSCPTRFTHQARFRLDPPVTQSRPAHGRTGPLRIPLSDRVGSALDVRHHTDGCANHEETTKVCDAMVRRGFVFWAVLDIMARQLRTRTGALTMPCFAVIRLSPL